MAFILTNQSYTAGERGALIISGVNTNTAGATHMQIDLFDVDDADNIRFEFAASSTDNDVTRQFNIFLRPGDTVNENSHIWLTIDTDPSRFN